MKRGLAGLVLGILGTANLAAAAHKVPATTEKDVHAFRTFTSGTFVGFEIKAGPLVYCGTASKGELYEIWDSSSGTLFVARDYGLNDNIFNKARALHNALLKKLDFDVVFLDSKEATRQQEIFSRYLEMQRFRPATSSSAYQKSGSQ